MRTFISGVLDIILTNFNIFFLYLFFLFSCKNTPTIQKRKESKVFQGFTLKINNPKRSKQSKTIQKGFSHEHS